MTSLGRISRFLMSRSSHSGLNSANSHYVRQTAIQHSRLATNHISAFYSSTTRGDSPIRKCSLVIFDKDGTLMEFGVGWEDWTRKLTHAMEVSTGLTLGDKILKMFGFDTKAKRWREGVMCDNPAKIVSTLSLFLQSEGLSKADADHTISQSFRDDHTTNPSHIQPISDPHAIFRTIKDYGKKVAICTSDSVYSTNQTIDKFELEKYTDFTFCGDDELFVSKPKPDNIYQICNALDVKLEETVMIGDSVRDMEMGRAAGAGLVIGVTSGVCERHELSPSADIVLPSIEESLEFYLPENYPDVYRKYCR